VKRTRHVVILGVAAVTAMSLVACGGDDDETERGSGAGGSTGEALPPPPDRAFGGLAAALEAQGLVVSRLGASSLDGAEVGVKVTGDKRGSARSFPTEAEAHEYADEVAKEGDKTTIVGTVVLQAPTQDNADFFADAYEGG
jgi:hypothetical protein